MSATVTAPRANPFGYHEIAWEKIRPLRNQVLIRWEEATDEIKCGKVYLARPETHKLAHFTGVVLAVGPEAAELLPGDRVVFDRFAEFERFFCPEMGRMALVTDTIIFLKVPPRTKIDGTEGDFDFNK